MPIIKRMARSSFTLLSGLADTMKCFGLRVRLAALFWSRLWLDDCMITDKQKKFLRARAHHLKPVVIAGNAGITEGVLRELDIALAHHELIKVRINAGDRSELKEMANSLCQSSNASLVQIIGHIVVLYRPAETAKIQLP